MYYALILAGGIGSRFWPFSRELEPKQFMQVTGSESLLQATVSRLKGLIAPSRIYIITNRIYRMELEKQVARFAIPAGNIILEPEGKNTAPAIGLCCRLIQRRDPEAVLVVLPSDHHIGARGRFQATLGKAIALAGDDFLVTIGIPPRAPSTGYGYLKVRPSRLAMAGGGRRVSYFSVERFLEKPPAAKAAVYFKDKRYYWNSGIFIWKAAVFLKELRTYLPGLSRQLSRIASPEDIPGVWGRIKPVSVDYGIMEHARKIALIPADFSWTDLGSWDALNEVLPRNRQGNIFQAECLAIKSKGVSVFSRGNRLISIIGLNDLIIADTPDALLVCNRSHAQEVKAIVELLKSKNRKEQRVHLTEQRPWGSYTVLQTGLGFKIKMIEIEPHKRLSLQRHKKRAEHWVVVSGCAKVTSERKSKLVQSNQSIYIPKGTMHRLENPGRRPVKIVEVQTGEYLEEDDIERFQDDYQRHAAAVVH